MRPEWALLLLLLALPAAAAGGPDGPYVAAATHEPAEPVRGQPLHVTVQLEPDVDAANVSLTHCRFDPAYACAIDYDRMAQQPNGSWVGTIRWDARFFQGATWVGYNLFIDLANGTTVKAPVEYVPGPPATLPEGADIYYVYQLRDPEPPSTPGPPVGLIVAGLVALVGGMRRRLHAP